MLCECVTLCSCIGMQFENINIFGWLYCRRSRNDCVDKCWRFLFVGRNIYFYAISADWANGSSNKVTLIASLSSSHAMILMWMMAIMMMMSMMMLSIMGCNYAKVHEAVRSVSNCWLLPWCCCDWRLLLFLPSCCISNVIDASPYAWFHLIMENWILFLEVEMLF